MINFADSMAGVGSGFKKMSEFYDIIEKRYDISTERLSGHNLVPYSEFFRTAGYSNDTISSVKIIDNRFACILEAIVQKTIPILLFTG